MMPINFILDDLRLEVDIAEDTLRPRSYDVLIEKINQAREWANFMIEENRLLRNNQNA